MLKTQVTHAVAFAVLDRPQAYNTLNLELVAQLSAQLAQWQKDPNIAVIVLRGAGPRAFCAGGDVKEVILQNAKGNTGYVTDFFAQEYRLDFAIHESVKPVVVIAHGFTMGGGIGLLAGATCRVVTESTQLAMPEAAIGFFADVGGSYFLNDLPGRLGLFLALTGTRLNAADALLAGLADFFIPDDQTAEFCTRLENTTWTSNADVNRRQLNALAKQLSENFAARLPTVQLAAHLDTINRVLAGHDARAVFARLLKLADNSDALLANAGAAFARGSPTSAFLIFEQLKRGQTLSLAACLRMELDLATQCGRHHDFAEGVRALLLDKDKNPQWQPKTLTAVTDELLLSHFESPWPAASHPLKDL